MDLLFVSTEGWWLIGTDGGYTQVRPYPRLHQATRVVAAFSNAHTGTLRFEGRPQYAAPLIERQVRQSGWVEGSTHVTIHELRRSAGGGAGVLQRGRPG